MYRKTTVIITILVSILMISIILGLSWGSNKVESSTNITETAEALKGALEVETTSEFIKETSKSWGSIEEKETTQVTTEPTEVVETTTIQETTKPEVIHIYIQEEPTEKQWIQNQFYMTSDKPLSEYIYININGYDSSYSDLVYEAISLLPYNVLEELMGNELYELRLVDSIEYNGLPNIAGITRSAGKLIEIKANKEDIPFTVIHEIAHALDNNSYKNSLSDGLQDIFNKEKDNFIPASIDNTREGYFKQDVKEYLACAFTAYVYEPEVLYNNCPETYHYLQCNFCMWMK